MAELPKMHVASDGTQAGSYNPLEAPYGIQMLRGEWRDGKRHHRAVPYKVYVPEGQTGPLPVILWSHGLGGSRDGAGFLSRHFAGRGYIVIHVQHHGTDSTLWEGKPGHPWDVIRATKIPRKSTLDRYQDIPFVLSRLASIGQDHKELEGMLDLNRMGMSGHSFGALTTQVMAGQHIVRPNSARQYDLYQPVFKAGILYSPVPLWKYPGLAGIAYGGIRIPLLHMTGTADESPIEGFGYELRRQIYDYAGAGANAARQYLLVLEDGDHMVYNGSRGKLAANPLRDRHEQVITAAATAFWDMYLKNDETAASWLEKGGFQSMLSGGDQFMYRL